MLDYYYSITKEDPGDLAPLWTAHALAETEIAKFHLHEVGITGGASLLDVGCSTGGMLIAAKAGFGAVTGVDVALRWLTIGLVRLREAGVEASLVCANAEALPFPDESFDLITSIDTIEHLRNAEAALGEMYRCSAKSAHVLVATNNRYAPLPDPQIHLWGTGWLPRSWQPAYVAWRRGDLHRYQVRMRSALEINRMVRRAGFSTLGTEAAPLAAPHRPNLESALRTYNRLRSVPLLKFIAPRLWCTGRKPPT
jgi:ubiquinone/menaquinone biosynthesis C-methylase UbiE